MITHKFRSSLACNVLLKCGRITSQAPPTAHTRRDRYTHPGHEVYKLSHSWHQSKRIERHETKRNGPEQDEISWLGWYRFSRFSPLVVTAASMLSRYCSRSETRPCCTGDSSIVTAVRIRTAFFDDAFASFARARQCDNYNQKWYRQCNNRLSRMNLSGQLCWWCDFLAAWLCLILIITVFWENMMMMMTMTIPGSSQKYNVGVYSVPLHLVFRHCKRLFSIYLIRLSLFRVPKRWVKNKRRASVKE